ncbi:MAG: carboxypeptidase regulatory-like domain-containing protein [Candidatus Hydrogenedentes bacterium]|nr:carboxypeptidase regulatory-like domain-containing protein [Candidatus Hydrogenedentota bacterium]
MIKIVSVVLIAVALAALVWLLMLRERSHEAGSLALNTNSETKERAQNHTLREPPQSPALTEDLPGPREKISGIGRIHCISVAEEGSWELSGLEVRLFPWPEAGYVLPEQEPLATKETPDSGAVSFDNLALGRYLVCLIGEGVAAYADVELLTRKPVGTAMLWLREAWPMSGWVRNGEGALVQGALVQVCSWREKNEGEVHPLDTPQLLAALTDNEGRFRINGIPVLPNYPHMEFQLLARMQAFPTVTSAFHLPGTDDVEIVLTLGGSASGSVIIQGTGQAVASVKVIVGEGAAEEFAVSEEGGHFLFAQLAEGVYRARVKHETWIAADPAFSFEVSQGAQTSGLLLEVCEGGVVSGRVYDDLAKNGIADIKVRAFKSGARRPSAEQVTNDAGEYRIGGLCAGKHSIKIIVPPDLAFPPPDSSVPSPLRERSIKQVMVVPGKETTGFDFILRAGALVTGIVLDETGTPVIGAAIVASNDAENRVGLAESDAEGSFQLALGTPCRQVTLGVSREGFATTNAGPFHLAGEALRNIEVVLIQESAVAGKVVTGRGEPAGAAFVFLTVNDNEGLHPVAQCPTDDNGTFRMGQLSAGTYGLMASSHKRFTDIEMQTSTILETTLAAGKERSNLRLVVDDLALSITGRVTDTTGRALEHVKIVALMEQGLGGSALSGPDGQYVINGLPAGDYDLRTGGLGVGSQTRSGVAAGSTEVDFVMGAPGAIEGKVVDAITRAPVVSFQIAHQPGPADRAGGWLRFQAVNDPQGRFRLESVDAGDATVFVQSGASVMAHAYVPSVIPGETTAGVLIELMPGYSLEGLVRNTEGEAVLGARILADDGTTASVNRDAWITRSDEAGHFTLPNLEGHVCTIVAMHDDYADGESQANPKLGQLVEIVLASGGYVEGTVTLAGQPVAGIPVLRELQEGRSVDSVNTDEGGGFRFDNLQAGIYDVTAQMGDRLDANQRRRTISVQVLLNQKTVANIDFPPATASLSGAISGSNDEPIAEVSVQLQILNSDGATELFFVRSDALGQYLFEFLPAGQGQLSLVGQHGALLYHEAVDLIEQERREQDVHLNEPTASTLGSLESSTS